MTRMCGGLCLPLQLHQSACLGKPVERHQSRYLSLLHCQQFCACKKVHVINTFKNRSSIEFKYNATVITELFKYFYVRVNDDACACVLG